MVSKKEFEMAYVSQERKAQLAPVIKSICKRYGVKASLAVRHHSTLVLNIKSGPIDFVGNFNSVMSRKEAQQINRDYIDVNTYWYHEHFTGEAKEFLTKVISAMNAGNHDRSDIQTDYFDVGWYIDVNVGRWNRPYALEK
jgi:hypothetical protein